MLKKKYFFCQNKLLIKLLNKNLPTDFDNLLINFNINTNSDFNLYINIKINNKKHPKFFRFSNLLRNFFYFNGIKNSSINSFFDFFNFLVLFVYFNNNSKLCFSTLDLKSNLEKLVLNIFKNIWLPNCLNKNILYIYLLYYNDEEGCFDYNDLKKNSIIYHELDILTTLINLHFIFFIKNKEIENLKSFINEQKLLSINKYKLLDNDKINFTIKNNKLNLKDNALKYKLDIINLILKDFLKNNNLIFFYNEYINEKNNYDNFKITWDKELKILNKIIEKNNFVFNLINSIQIDLIDNFKEIYNYYNETFNNVTVSIHSKSKKENILFYTFTEKYIKKINNYFFNWDLRLIFISFKNISNIDFFFNKYIIIKQNYYNAIHTTFYYKEIFIKFSEIYIKYDCDICMSTFNLLISFLNTNKFDNNKLFNQIELEYYNINSNLTFNTISYYDFKNNTFLNWYYEYTYDLLLIFDQLDYLFIYLFKNENEKLLIIKENLNYFLKIIYNYKNIENNNLLKSYEFQFTLFDFFYLLKNYFKKINWININEITFYIFIKQEFDKKFSDENINFYSKQENFLSNYINKLITYINKFLIFNSKIKSYLYSLKIINIIMNNNIWYNYIPFFDFRGRIYLDYSEYSWISIKLLRSFIKFKEINYNTSEIILNIKDYEENLIKFYLNNYNIVEDDYYYRHLIYFIKIQVLKVASIISSKEKTFELFFNSGFNYFLKNQELDEKKFTIDEYFKYLNIKKKINYIILLYKNKEYINFINYISSDNIGIDISMNGLTHITGLLKNINLLKLEDSLHKVNLLESEVKNDYYLNFLEKILLKIENININKLNNHLDKKKKSWKIEFDNTVVINIFLKLIKNNKNIIITRKMVKNPIMTVFYGSTNLNWWKNFNEFICNDIYQYNLSKTEEFQELKKYINVKQINNILNYYLLTIISPDLKDISLNFKNIFYEKLKIFSKKKENIDQNNYFQNYNLDNDDFEDNSWDDNFDFNYDFDDDTYNFDKDTYNPENNDFTTYKNQIVNDYNNFEEINKTEFFIEQENENLLDIYIYIEEEGLKVSLMYFKLNGDINFSKLKTSLIANIIHTLDSILCRRVISQNNFYIKSIHDCFFCSTMMTESLILSYNKIYYEFYLKYNLEDIIYVDTTKQNKKKLFNYNDISNEKKKNWYLLKNKILKSNNFKFE